MTKIDQPYETSINGHEPTLVTNKASLIMLNHYQSTSIIIKQSIVVTDGNNQPAMGIHQLCGEEDVDAFVEAFRWG